MRSTPRTVALRYVAGSHREGYRPHARSQILGFSQGISDYGPSDFVREVAVPLKPGDAVAHHGMTIHRADANMSAVRHRPLVCDGFPRGFVCAMRKPLAVPAVGLLPASIHGAERLANKQARCSSGSCPRTNRITCSSSGVGSIGERYLRCFLQTCAVPVCIRRGQTHRSAPGLQIDTRCIRLLI